MEKAEFELGDKVYHLSLSSVIWVVEKLEDDLVYCSTLIKGTMELKKEKFSPSSIKKITQASPRIISKTKRDSFW